MVGNMPFDTCVFHIGLPKAGSTSIQKTLNRNRKIIESNGIVAATPEYLQKICRGEGPVETILFYPFFGNVADVNPLMANGFDTERKAYDTYKNIIHKFCDNIFKVEGNSIVISSETVAAYVEFSRLMALRDFLYKLAKEVFVLVYVRDPVPYASSVKQNRIKNGSDVDLSNVAPHHGNCIPFNIRNIIEQWRNVFGFDYVMMRRIGGDTLFNGDLVEDFLNCIGFPPDLLFTLHRPLPANTALSLEAAMIGAATNRWRPTFVNGQRNPERAEMRTLLQEIPGERFGLPAGTLETVYKATREDAAWIGRETGRSATAEQKPAPAEAPKWSEDTLAAIGTLLNDMKKEKEEWKEACEQTRKKYSALEDEYHDLVAKCGIVAYAARQNPEILQQAGGEPSEPPVGAAFFDAIAHAVMAATSNGDEARALAHAMLLAIERVCHRPSNRYRFRSLTSHN